MKIGITAVVVIATALMTSGGCSETRVNADSLIVQDFSKRVSDYQQLAKTLEDKLTRLKATGSQASIEEHQHALADAIREERKGAKAGDIFSPKISAEFRRLTALAMQGGDAARIRKSLQNSEPVKLQLRVNDSYPSGIPQQSTPPSLLLNLPPLPPNLEFRLLGTTLILLDSKANLVVDLMPNAIA
jgi:hypothetical protein